MPVLPKTRDAMIEWLSQRIDAWEADPAALGLSAGQVAAARAALNASAAKVDEMYQKRNAAQAATEAADALAGDLRAMTGRLINTIKAFAEAGGDADVYERAQVPMKRPPTPAPPADAPTNLAADPRADGSIALSWKGSIARNQTFDVQRALDDGPFTFMTNVRGTRLLDRAVPVGTARVSYRVYGRRNGRRSGQSAETLVQFGVTQRRAAQRASAPVQRAA